MPAPASRQAEVAQSTRIRTDLMVADRRRLAADAHPADLRGPRVSLWQVGFLAEVVDHQAAEDPQAVQETQGPLAAEVRLPTDLILQETRGIRTITHLG